MSIEYQHIVDKIVKGNGPVLKDVNPSTNETIAQLKTMTSQDLDEAVDKADQAFSQWSSFSPFKRGLILLKAGELMEQQADEYTELMTVEEGKPLKDSKLEVIRSYNTLKFYGAVSMKYGGKTIPSANDNTSIYTTREPLGTVALISPWNFPLSIPVWKVAPALASGNTVIMKPASATPIIVAKLVETLQKAGMPEDVVSVAVGSGREIGDRLVKNEKIKAVSFTGSVSVGKGIYQSVGKKNTMTRIQLELGGKNAVYVDESADLEASVKNAVAGAFGLTGQSCTATSRLLVHKRVYDTFLKKLVSATKEWKYGDGRSKEADMGPVVDKQQFETDISYIEAGKQEGAKMIVGERSPGGNGLFLAPVVFDAVSPDMKIFKEEIFGPVLAVTVVDGLDEAINLANSVPYGHTSGIMTSSLKNAMEYSRRVDAGVIKINKPTVGLELQAPFGAFKSSGANTWKEMGEEALDFYSREKTTYMGW